MNDQQLRSTDVAVRDGLVVHIDLLGAGVPTLLLHGSGPGASGLSNFRGNMGPLAGAGFKAVAVDLVGWGASSKPVDRDYDMDLQVNCLLDVLDAQGFSRVNLVGNSMGGAVALRFAMSHPDRVERLVLLAPGGLAGQETYLRMPGIEAMIGAMLGPQGPDMDNLRKVFALQVFDTSLVPDGLIRERLAVAKTQPKEIYTRLRIGNLALRLGEIRCPVLAFWGAQDRFCPIETAQVLTGGIEDCRVILMSRCGHWAQVEREAFFNEELIRFLKG